MIDTSREDVFPLGQVRDDYPSRQPGKRINISTVWRWAMHGCRGIRLETVVIGGGRFTSREAVQRFVERLSEARTGGGQLGQTGSCRTIARRQRDSAEAGRKLEKQGA